MNKQLNPEQYIFFKHGVLVCIKLFTTGLAKTIHPWTGGVLPFHCFLVINATDMIICIRVFVWIAKSIWLLWNKPTSIINWQCIDLIIVKSTTPNLCYYSLIPDICMYQRIQTTLIFKKFMNLPNLRVDNPLTCHSVKEYFRWNEESK